MSSSGRGGSRSGSGRPSPWKNTPTQTIRVPAIFADKLLEIAQQLDQGLDGELIISPEDYEIRSQAKQERLPLTKLRVYKHSGHKAIRIQELIDVLQAQLDAP